MSGRFICVTFLFTYIYVNKKLVEPAVRPEVKVPEDVNPYWLTGFISAEGCFNVHIYKSAKSKAGYNIGIRFLLTQNKRDSELMYKIKDYFKSGNIRVSDRDNTVELYIGEVQALKHTLVPFLEKYSLIGAKNLEYYDFKTVLNLIDNKAHLFFFYYL